jgi:hypothetical protein
MLPVVLESTRSIPSCDLPSRYLCAVALGINAVYKIGDRPKVKARAAASNLSFPSDRPEDEQATRRAGVPFQWAWNWIEQHQEAIAP